MLLQGWNRCSMCLCQDSASIVTFQEELSHLVGPQGPQGQKEAGPTLGSAGVVTAAHQLLAGWFYLALRLEEREEDPGEDVET